MRTVPACSCPTVTGAVGAAIWCRSTSSQPVIVNEVHMLLFVGRVLQAATDGDERPAVQQTAAAPAGMEPAQIWCMFLLLTGKPHSIFAKQQICRIIQITRRLQAGASSWRQIAFQFGVWHPVCRCSIGCWTCTVASLIKTAGLASSACSVRATNSKPCLQ